MAEIGTLGSVWVATRGDQEVEVSLPADLRVGDFDLRMGELLVALALWEHRPQAEVFKDLQQLGSDVVRVRLSADRYDGTIPIGNGANLIDQAREMLLAAASSTVRRSPFFARRKPPEALDYLDRVRMGQTEIGSYVATFLSPVTPAQLPQGTLDIADPFERKVVETLIESLGAARDAAVAAHATGDYTGFVETVQIGVSANLCDAVAGLTEAGHGAQGVEIAVTWSPLRPTGEGAVSRVQVTPDLAPIFREAARTLKEQTPPADVVLVGPVVKLARAEGHPNGTIWLVGLVGQSLKTVAVTLGPAEYELAAEANLNEVHIQVRGTMVRTGRSYELQNPQDMTIFEEPDLDSLLDDGPS